MNAEVEERITSKSLEPKINSAGMQPLLPVEPLLERRESHETAGPAGRPVRLLTLSLPASP